MAERLSLDDVKPTKKSTKIDEAPLWMPPTVFACTMLFLFVAGIFYTRMFWKETDLGVAKVAVTLPSQPGNYYKHQIIDELSASPGWNVEFDIIIDKDSAWSVEMRDERIGAGRTIFAVLIDNHHFQYGVCAHAGNPGDTSHAYPCLNNAVAEDMLLLPDAHHIRLEVVAKAKDAAASAASAIKMSINDTEVLSFNDHSQLYPLTAINAMVVSGWKFNMENLRIINPQKIGPFKY